jgi:hypothetical protein
MNGSAGGIFGDRECGVYVDWLRPGSLDPTLERAAQKAKEEHTCTRLEIESLGTVHRVRLSSEVLLFQGAGTIKKTHLNHAVEGIRDGRKAFLWTLVDSVNPS